MIQDTQTHLLGIKYLTDAGEHDTGFAVVRDYKEFEYTVIANDALGFIEIVNIKPLSEYKKQYQDTTNSYCTEGIILGLVVLGLIIVKLIKNKIWKDK